MHEGSQLKDTIASLTIVKDDENKAEIKIIQFSRFKIIQIDFFLSPFII